MVALRHCFNHCKTLSTEVAKRLPNSFLLCQAVRTKVAVYMSQVTTQAVPHDVGGLMK